MESPCLFPLSVNGSQYNLKASVKYVLKNNNNCFVVYLKVPLLLLTGFACLLAASYPKLDPMALLMRRVRQSCNFPPATRSFL